MTEHDLMTVAEVATTLRMSKMTVYRLIKRSELPAIKIGTTYRVKRVIVQDILAGGGVSEA